MKATDPSFLAFQPAAKTGSEPWIGALFKSPGAVVAGVGLFVMMLAGAMLASRSMTMPSVSKKADPTTVALEELAVLRTALAEFKAEQNHFPAVEGGLMTLSIDPGIEGWRQYVTWIRPDPWKQPYVYHLDDDQKAVVFSSGPDTLVGTSDDIYPPHMPDLPNMRAPIEKP